MSAPTHASPAEAKDAARVAPPPLSHYLAMVAGVWVFVGVMTWILAAALGSWRGIALLGGFLAAGFLLVALFDYAWLRWGKGED